jgi:hypothetical protein
LTCSSGLVHAAADSAENVLTQELNTFRIQATLVIRDLTLRVFAITRFRGEKSRE